MTDTRISALTAGDASFLTATALFPVTDANGTTVRYTLTQLLAAFGITVGGTDGYSVVATGTGGTAPTGNRSAILSADTPSSVTYPGAAFVAFKRSGTAFWYAGLREVATDASAATGDFILYDILGGKTQFALSNTTGNARAAGTIRGKALAHDAQTVTYSASMNVDLSLGNTATITATNGTAFTINAPTNMTTGQWLTLRIRNTSGGALGAITWNAVFKMAAWTSPATANSRAITFDYDGTNWIERTRNAADVPN